MELGGEEGLKYEINVDGEQLEQVSDFKYLRFVLDESGADVTKYCTVVVSGRKVAGKIRSLVNEKTLQPKYAKVLHEALFMLVLPYGNEKMI